MRPYTRGVICAELKGGLGNQLFILAAGLQQARRLKTELHLFPKFNPSDDHAIFRLDFFRLPDDVYIDSKSMSSKFARFGFKSGLNVYKEQAYNYENAINHIKGRTLISGYFQSWKYFDNVASEIWSMLVSNTTYFELAMKQIHIAQKRVGMHIRRGDYLVSPYKELYFELGPEYYLSALRRARTELEKQSSLGGVETLLFSDDAEGAAKMLRGEQLRIVDLQGAAEAMLSMSLCDSVIIANSSFSWWGAWLASMNGSNVYCPEKWFIGKEYNIEDLYPSTWEIL